LGLGELAWLVRFLGLSVEELLDPNSFDSRLRVQKAVFFLKHLGVKPFTEYEFNMYLRGPYSPALAQDYYRLRGVEPTSVDLGDRADLLRWFMAHRSDWLEVCTSILSIRERYPKIGDEETYELITFSKPWVERSFFEDVIKELKAKGLRSATHG